MAEAGPQVEALLWMQTSSAQVSRRVPAPLVDDVLQDALLRILEGRERVRSPDAFQPWARRVVANDFEWFRKTIIADGPHFSVWVNGYQVTDWSDQRKPHENPRKGQRLEAGSLMIQGHDETTDLDFRRIEIRETPPRWSQR